MTGKRLPAGKIRRQLSRSVWHDHAELNKLPAKLSDQLPLSEKRSVALLGRKTLLDKLGHIAFIGASGRGKTTGAGPTFRSIVEATTPGSGQKLIIIDVKGEYLSWLKGMKRDFKLISFTYQEGKHWALQKDVASFQRIVQLAWILYPELEGNNAFFRNAARAIFSAILMSLFYRHGTDWQLDDAINLALSDVDTLTEVIRGFPRGSDILNTFLRQDDAETLYKVTAEIASLIFPYMLVAAKAQHSTGVSLTEFLQGEGILVIKLNPEKIELEKPFLTALITCLFDLLISRPQTSKKDTVVWLEDWHFFGKIPRMERLSEMSRSCGVIIAVLFQTIESLRSKESYSDQADSILANFPFLIMLGNRSPITAKWCARQFGSHWLKEDLYTTNFSERGPQPTVRESRSVQDVVLDSAFLNLPAPSFENGYRCYMKTSLWGSEANKRIPWAEILRRLPPQPDTPVVLHEIPSDKELPAPFSPERKKLMVSGRTVAVTAESSPSISPLLSVFEEEVRKGLYQVAEDVLAQIIFDEYERLLKEWRSVPPTT